MAGLTEDAKIRRISDGGGGGALEEIVDWTESSGEILRVPQHRWALSSH